MLNAVWNAVNLVSGSGIPASNTIVGFVDDWPLHRTFTEYRIRLALG